MRRGLRVVRIVLSLLVPVALTIGFALMFGDDPSRLGMSPGQFGRLSYLISITTGFALLAGLCGRYVLLVAVVYFPMMLALLAGVILLLPSIFHSDFP